VSESHIGPITRSKLKPQALSSLRYGARVVYHVGHLYEDREHDPAADAMANEAQRLADTGAILLFQRRNCLGRGFDYEAVGARRPRGG